MNIFLDWRLPSAGTTLEAMPDMSPTYPFKAYITWYQGQKVILTCYPLNTAKYWHWLWADTNLKWPTPAAEKWSMHKANFPLRCTSTSIIGLVVEFVVAIDEARVRFTDDAQLFLFALSS